MICCRWKNVVATRSPSEDSREEMDAHAPPHCPQTDSSRGNDISCGSAGGEDANNYRSSLLIIFRDISGYDHLRL